MKRTNKTSVMLVAMSLVFLFFTVSCEENALDHGHMQHVEFSYSPMPAVVGAEITLLFTVESEEVLVSVDNPACEIHDVGAVALGEGEAGHYTGQHTFASAGTYAVHFTFSHEGSPVEEEFSLVVE